MSIVNSIPVFAGFGIIQQSIIVVGCLNFLSFQWSFCHIQMLRNCSNQCYCSKNTLLVFLRQSISLKSIVLRVQSQFASPADFYAIAAHSPFLAHNVDVGINVSVNVDVVVVDVIVSDVVVSDVNVAHVVVVDAVVVSISSQPNQCCCCIRTRFSSRRQS